MKTTKIAVLATAVCVSATLAMAADSAPSANAGEEKAVTTCQDCHGPKGNSVSGTFPRLNGQQADYISAQLKAFRDHKRSDPHAVAFMWGMASQLDDETIDALAKYFSSQTPTKAQSGGDLSAKGKDIYMNGAAAQNIPACAACHGEHGEGNSIIPRLAGQHSDYLKKQLEAFRSTLREGDIMHANTKDMTDSQIEALVSYLAND